MGVAKFDRTRNVVIAFPQQSRVQRPRFLLGRTSAKHENLPVGNEQLFDTRRAVAIPLPNPSQCAKREILLEYKSLSKAKEANAKVVAYPRNLVTAISQHKARSGEIFVRINVWQSRKTLIPLTQCSGGK